jgi:hypothetical protein
MISLAWRPGDRACVVNDNAANPSETSRFAKDRGMRRWLAITLLAGACSSDGSQAADAGMDAMRRLELTVDGVAAIQPTTRSLKISITASGIARTDTIPVAGLPATVDLPAPIQLTTWEVVVDGYDINGQRIGHGETDLPAGTAEASVSLAAL